MSEKTAIQWTDATWNPLRGTKGRWHCVRISGACKNCYAATMNHRFGGPDYVVGADTPRLDEKALTLPLRWREPRRVFVCSMTDLFLDAHTDEWIDRVFATMWTEYMRRYDGGGEGDAPGDRPHGRPTHVYQVLTKRAARMQRYVSDPDTVQRVGRLVAETVKPFGLRVPKSWWPIPSLWLGVSVEDQATADARIPLLLQTPAAVRFVSYEPALGPVTFRGHIMTPELAAQCVCGHGHGFERCPNYGGVAPTCHRLGCACAGFRRPLGVSLDWIIVGGESGPGARPFDVAWARSTIAQCRAAGVACFVKQLGAHAWDSVALALHGKAFPDDVRTIRRGEVTDADAAAFWRLVEAGSLPLGDRKGGDPAEWPEDLRVREFPR